MRVLLLNQCFYPDVVASGQQLTDLAIGLAEKGHSVTVVTSSRGYDDPRVRFPNREVWKNISIFRLRTFGFGKSSKWRRALDFGSFFVSSVFLLLRLQRFDLVLAMTSPPLISFLASLFVQLKGGRFVFWAMDLNPDEAIVAGWLKERSITARVLQWSLRYSLRRADKIIVLDRFMKQRMHEKRVPDRKLAVIPPWSHDDAARFDKTERQKFRAAHGLTDKYVVMYSGNHSPCHPLDSLLEAARKLAQNAEVAFLFVGGGSEFKKVKDFASDNALNNITCLPYQSLTILAGSLSSADLHIIVMGNGFVGIVHPCKIYNILAVGSRFLYIGPATSHIGDIVAALNDSETATEVRHGEVDLIISCILAGVRKHHCEEAPPARQLAARFSKEMLLPQTIRLLESVLSLPARHGASRSEMKARHAHIGKIL